MPLRIYQLEHSPFCIPVTRALEAHGVPFEAIEVPNHDRRIVIEATGGASYQVPVLEDNGRIVHEDSPDSQNVPRYLDSRYCGGCLFPAASEGWQALLIPYLENEVESATFKLCDMHYIPSIKDLVARTMIIRHKERRFGMGCVDRWRREEDELRYRADQLIRPLDAILNFSPFLTGNAPVYVDYLLYGILRNLTWNGWNVLPDLPAVAEVYLRMETHRACS